MEHISTSLSAARRWENLTLRDRFIFAKVMGDPENALPFIRRLFPDLDISGIRLIESEKTQEGAVDSRAVRFDVYICDNADRAFILEMQVVPEDSLPKRARYYGDMADEMLLSRGQPYRDLPPVYIVFLCPFDLFGKGRHRYTFESLCIEDTAIPLGDASCKVFLNLRGILPDIPEKLRNVLEYMVRPEAVPENDPYIAQLKEAVDLAKQNAHWRREYMRYEDEMEQITWRLGQEIRKKVIAEISESEKARGRELGLAEGKALGLAEGKELGIAEGKELGIAEGKELGIAEGKELGIAEGLEKGTVLALSRLIQAGTISREAAAASAGLSEVEFREKCRAFGLDL